MDQKYKDNLRKHAKQFQDEWHNRFRYCSRRVLAAVCFREASQSTFKKTESTLLPPIGFYYAVFHMSIAMLSLDYATAIKELSKMRHNKLQNLVQSRLVDRKIIPVEFLEILKSQRELREYANYILGGKIIEDDKHDYKYIVPNLYRITERSFDIAISFIHNICVEIENYLPSSSPIQVCIGDDIGDDIYNMYLSDDDEKRVVEYLIKNNLTT